MTQNQEFMLLFRYAATNEMPSAEQMQEMQQQWGAFIGGIAAAGKLINTYQLGFEGNTISADGNINEGPYSDEGILLSGNMMIKADGLHEATEIAKGCPILKMGGEVEIRSIIPMN